MLIQSYRNNAASIICCFYGGRASITAHHSIIFCSHFWIFPQPAPFIINHHKSGPLSC
ncbi:hypothetical protein LINGRAHAP2_LOCUS6506, partial [Linum grandiflorum]